MDQESEQVRRLYTDEPGECYESGLRQCPDENRAENGVEEST